MKRQRMSRVTFRLILVLILISTVAFAQDWKGKGRVGGVVLTEDGEPIQGCKVILTSSRFPSANIEIMTDNKGKWTASMLRGGAWNIDFVAEGYEVKKISTSISEVLRAKPIEVELKRTEKSVVTEKVTGFLAKGNELFGQRKFQEALEEYQKIALENPLFYQIHQNIGNCYYELGETDKAIEEYKIVLENDPQSAEALVSLGNIYLEKGELEKGLNYVNQINEENITNPLTFYNIGTLFFNRGKIDIAIEYYLKTIERDPNLSDAYYQIALCYVSQNDRESAIENFEKFLEINPESPKAENVKNMIEYLRKQQLPFLSENRYPRLHEGLISIG